MNKNTAYEVILCAVIMALCSLIAVNCMIKYKTMSANTRYLDTGIGAVQDVADAISACKGDYDDMVRVLGQGAAGNNCYMLSLDDGCKVIASKRACDGYLGTAEIWLDAPDGENLISVMASWQEDVYELE